MGGLGGTPNKAGLYFNKLYKIIEIIALPKTRVRIAPISPMVSAA